MAGWKQYEDPQLSIVYNRLPDAPSDYRIASPAAGCGTAGAPIWINQLRATFAWRVTDPDGGNVYSNFDLLTSGSVVFRPSQVLQPSGSLFTLRLPPGTIANGGTYEWRVGGEDAGERPAGTKGPMRSCYFTVKTSKPGVPQITSPGYVEHMVTDPPPLERIFTLGATTSDTIGFRYEFDADSAAARPVTGGSTITITAPDRAQAPGAHWIVAQAVDRAGNVSDARVFRYAVATTPVAAYWKMDATGPVIPDAAQGAQEDPDAYRELAFATNPARVAGVFADFGLTGPADLALNLDGHQSGIARTSSGPGSPVADSAGAFTVTAFVKPGGDPTSDQIVVSQDARHTPAFALGRYTSGCPVGQGSCWGFTHATTDTHQPLTTRVTSTRPVLPDGWTLLVARYTPAGSGPGSLALTVCPLGTATSPAPDMCTTIAHIPAATTTTPLAALAWSAQGALRIGQQITTLATLEAGFVGAVDEVRVYPDAISDAVILRIAAGSDEAR